MGSRLRYWGAMPRTPWGATCAWLSFSCSGESLALDQVHGLSSPSGVSQGAPNSHAGGADVREKATAIHVFCPQERHRGERLSRHWHDLVRLDKAGIAAKALNDHVLALSVARHKSKFFSENDACGVRINYGAPRKIGQSPPVSCRLTMRKSVLEQVSYGLASFARVGDGNSSRCPMKQRFPVNCSLFRPAPRTRYLPMTTQECWTVECCSMRASR